MPLYITKIKYGHPWHNYRSSRGRRTVSTRLPMVSMSRASESLVRARSYNSLVRAWANSCRVRGRLSLFMMARPKSSKECSIGSISREQVGHGTSTSPYTSRNYFTAAAIWANVVVLQPKSSHCHNLLKQQG